MWRLRPAVLASAAWTMLTFIRLRRRLRRDGVATRVAPPPAWIAEPAMFGVLNRLAPTCLERALIVQAWLSSHGEPRDIVVGVPPVGMRSATAHAWIDGRPPGGDIRYVEIHRLAP